MVYPAPERVVRTSQSATQCLKAVEPDKKKLEGARTHAIGGENGFALIFVKSCHGWVLFP